jgi:hypothetical protein
MVDSENHNLQEYTYKKITPCDVCGQVLRGKLNFLLATVQKVYLDYYILTVTDPKKLNIPGR